MMEAATPINPKKGAEVGQSSEIAKSKTVESIFNKFYKALNELVKRIEMEMFDGRQIRRGKVL